MDLNENLVGTVFTTKGKSSWYIINEIGRGSFGIICAVRDIESGQLSAIKFEDAEKGVLKYEVYALQRLQSCPSICRVHDYGKAGKWNFMVMGLMGENLSELCKARGGKFNIITTLCLGIKALSCLQQIHEQGFIHRDIKPSNFVIGLFPQAQRREVYLIDFGLARRFVEQDGQAKAARDLSAFRGTARYASINSHMCRDLGPRDDLWSLFYLLVEFAQGFLPWKSLKDKDQIGEMKRTYNSPELVSALPEEFLTFMNYVKSLEYETKIDYDYLTKLLTTALKRYGGDLNSVFGWENQAPATRFLAAFNYAAQRGPEDSPTTDSQPKKDSPAKSRAVSAHFTQRQSTGNPFIQVSKAQTPVDTDTNDESHEHTDQKRVSIDHTSSSAPQVKFHVQKPGQLKQPNEPATPLNNSSTSVGFSGAVLNFGAFGSAVTTTETKKGGLVSLDDASSMPKHNAKVADLLSSHEGQQSKFICDFANIAQSRVPDTSKGDHQSQHRDRESMLVRPPTIVADPESITESSGSGPPTDPTRSSSKSKSSVNKIQATKATKGTENSVSSNNPPPSSELVAVAIDPDLELNKSDVVPPPGGPGASQKCCCCIL